MRFLLSASVLAALVSASAPALAQSRGASMMISMMDMDEDGRVTSDEWADASFPPLAVFGGLLKLTLADYRETLTGTPEETEKTAKANFVKFDVNKDGFLTGEEFRATFAADFAAMDTDKDGNLTVDEYDKAQPRQP
jgi:Ca2+-binding EF-hand superfamily protein